MLIATVMSLSIAGCMPVPCTCDAPMECGTMFPSLAAEAPYDWEVIWVCNADAETAVPRGPASRAVSTMFVHADALDGWDVEHVRADTSSHEIDHGFHVTSIEHVARGTNSWADVTALHRV